MDASLSFDGQERTTASAVSSPSQARYRKILAPQ